MADYKVIIYKKAQIDLKDIVEYLNELDEQAALKYFDLLVTKIQNLCQMPHRCPLSQNIQLRIRGYRTMVVKDYIVFYVIKDNVVQIRRILFARRRYEHIL
ncbi:MAG: type II toxin-antitoxin system RelE/ParE family toxin [Erysipelotrichaceae bacterium]